MNPPQKTALGWRSPNTGNIGGGPETIKIKKNVYKLFVLWYHNV
jgi:hypothetical protein